MTIDTHHHMLPDFFWQETENADAPVGGLAPLQWSKETTLSFMDDAGIDVAVLSVSTPGVHTGDNARRRHWRAGATNSRPSSSPQDQTGLRVLPVSHCQTSRPPWRSCRTPLTCSAWMGSCCSRTRTGCTWRFAIIDEMDFIAGAEQRGTAADMFRRMYWDTALAASDPVLHMLRDVAGIDQVLYGTDFPYQRRDLAVRSKQQILHRVALNDLERGAILGSNASRLLQRRIRASRDVI